MAGLYNFVTYWIFFIDMYNHNIYFLFLPSPYPFFLKKTFQVNLDYNNCAFMLLLFTVHFWKTLLTF